MDGICCLRKGRFGKVELELTDWLFLLFMFMMKFNMR